MKKAVIILFLYFILLIITFYPAIIYACELTVDNLNVLEKTPNNSETKTVETINTITTKWPGLGMCLFSNFSIRRFNKDIDILLTNGFTELRIDIPDYQNDTLLTDSKSAVQVAVAKGAKVVWGVSSNSHNNTDFLITEESWPNFRQAILDAAQWAQSNGVYEFQIGNEEEWHVDGTTLTAVQIIENLKSIASEVKTIFTNGKISYTCFTDYIDYWIMVGKGDIDILAFNMYRGGNDNYNNDWKRIITKMVNGFGVESTYITEFNISWSSLDDYSTDEKIQAVALKEMIDYIKDSGIKKAFYFIYRDTPLFTDYGARKYDGTYRLLWDHALLNSGL